MALNPPVRDWHGKSVWLVGASSGIGRATASALHARGARVWVSARNAAALERFVADHPGAVAVPLDTTDGAAVAAAAQQVFAHGALDHVVYCAGHYAAMRATALDLDDMLRHVQVNYTGALRVLDAVLPHLLTQARPSSAANRVATHARAPAGHISLVASVAGFRGLPNSLAYGPTKAALINLAETLYLDLRDSGIAVSLINPGFVETPLTAQNQFEMPALIRPEQAATEILRGWERGAFEIHFPRRFTGLMKLLQLLPCWLYFPVVRRFTGA